MAHVEELCSSDSGCAVVDEKAAKAPKKAEGWVEAP